MDKSFTDKLKAKRAARMASAVSTLSATVESPGSSVYPTFSPSDTKSPFGEDTNIYITTSEGKISRPPTVTSKNIEEAAAYARSTANHRKLKRQPNCSVIIDPNLGDIMWPPLINPTDEESPIGTTTTTTDLLTNLCRDMMEDHRQGVMLAAMDHLRRASLQAQHDLEDDDDYQPRSPDECTDTELEAYNKTGLGFQGDQHKDERKKKFLGNGDNAPTHRAWRASLAKARVHLRTFSKSGTSEEDAKVAKEARKTINKLCLAIDKNDTAGDASKGSHGTRRSRLSQGTADHQRALTLGGKTSSLAGTTTATDARGDTIATMDDDSLTAIYRTEVWTDVISLVTESLAKNQDPDLTIKQFRSEVEEAIAKRSITTAGLALADFPLAGSTPDAQFENVVDTIQSIWVTIQRKEAELIEDRRLDSDEATKLRQLIEKIKNMDYLIAAGGGVQIQRAFDMVFYTAMYVFQGQESPQAQSVRREHMQKAIHDGSLAGQVLGVIEHGAGYVEGLERKLNGKVTKDSILNYCIQHRRVDLKPKEAVSDYLDRVYDLLYIRIKDITRRNHTMVTVVANAVIEGTLDMVTTSCVGIASCPRLSHEMRAMARKEITGIGTARRITTTQEAELNRFMSLRERARAIEEDENAAKLFGMGAEATKGYKTGFNVSPFVAPAFSWGETDTEEPEEKSELQLLREEVKAMSTMINEQKQTSGQGRQHANQTGTNGRSKKQQERDEKYWNDPVNKAIKDNDFKDGEYDPNIECDICGGPHRRLHCGRIRWDKHHNQARAHCNGRCIAFYKSKGYPFDRPAEGTYKPYPHGPRCFGDIDPPEDKESQESKTQEKSARELELEKEIAELKKGKEKTAKSLSAEDDAEGTELGMYLREQAAAEIARRGLSDAALDRAREIYENGLDEIHCVSHSGCPAGCNHNHDEESDGDDNDPESVEDAATWQNATKGNKKARRKRKEKQVRFTK